MNLSELAKICNVSVSTASKALSGAFDVSEETREIVISTAKKHGCFEKYYKPKYNKTLIAVICPEFQGVHYGQMATYIENAITERGGTTILSVSNFSNSTQNELIKYFTKFSKVDGIIVIDSAGKIRNDTDVPIVQIGLENESSNVDCVNVDSLYAMRGAVKYLIDNGKNKIGFIGEKFAYAEYEYFTQTMKGLGLDIDEKNVVISDKRFYDAGYYGVDEMLKNPLPDAIFAAYSHIAVGMLERLKEAKISVPDDVSIVCMDDIVNMLYSDLKLACIKMPMIELCGIALDLLYKKMESEYKNIRQSITVTRSFEKGESIKN